MQLSTIPFKGHIHNREIWHYHYLNYLIDMYYIFITFMQQSYSKIKIDWNNQSLFNNFSKFIYQSSSKRLDLFA